jgi:hypothetical protein
MGWRRRTMKLRPKKNDEIKLRHISASQETQRPV